MAESWPLVLQQKLNQADFQEILGDTTLRSEVEIGLSKVRRRYTRGVNAIAASIFIERTEVETFKTFYNTTLNGGVNTFEFTDPFSDTLQEFRFVTDTPPQIVPVGGNTFNLRMQWERIP